MIMKFSYEHPDLVKSHPHNSVASGHIVVSPISLGGALASMFAFKLAGENNDWLPRPITCISFASPYNGSDGYRKAFEVRI